MTHDPDQRIPDDPAAIRRSKAARRVFRIIGLALAVVVAAVMYVALFRPSASSGYQNTPTSPASSASSGSPSSSPSPAHQITSHQVLALRALATLAASGTPGSAQFDPTVQFDPTGKIVVAVGVNGQISAWSADNGQPLSNFAALPPGTTTGSGFSESPAFSPDGAEFSIVATDNSGGEVADVWNVATGQETTVPLAAVSSNLTPDSVAPGPGGLIADTYSNGAVGLMAMTSSTGLPDVMLPLHPGAGLGYQISTPTFSPDGGTIAVSDDLGVIHLVNVPGKRLAAALTAEKIYNTQAVNGLVSMDIDTIAFSPDSKLIACGTESGIIRVWDVATGQNVAAFNVNGTASGTAAARPVKTLIFSPDGKTLVTADNADNTLAVWDVASGHQVATLNTGNGTVASAAFTANGTLIAATTGNSAAAHRIELWTTGKPLADSSS